VSFGTYDVYSGSHLDSTGTVTARCLLGIGVTIGLSTGGAGSYAPRQLANGGASLQYNLYTDAVRSTVWGSGGGSTATVTILLQALVPVNRTVHARVFAAQDIPAGLYSDSVIVSFVF
jgi:spore coat protein U-like protein